MRAEARHQESWRLSERAEVAAMSGRGAPHLGIDHLVVDHLVVDHPDHRRRGKGINF